MSQKKNRELKKIAQQVKTVERTIDFKFGIKQTLLSNWKFLLCVCLGIVILYLNALNGAFVSDDYATITQNAMIGDFSAALKGTTTGMSNYLLYKLFGYSNPFPYHVFSLILYLSALIASFLFVDLLTNSQTIARMSLLLFAVNPTHVESVSWISGKPYLILALLTLLAMLFFVLFINTRDKKYVPPFVVFAVLCFLTERVRFFALVLLIVSYMLTFDWYGKHRINWFKMLLFLIVLLIGVGVYIYPAIMERVYAVNSGTNGSGGLFYDPLFQYPTAVSKYLQVIFAPFDLTLYHTMFVFPVWLNFGILLTYLSMTIYFWFSDKRIFYFLSMVFLATAPSMAPVKVSWLVAERYVFLGSLGFAVFCSYLLLWMSKYFRLIPATLFVSMLVLYLVRTYVRNIDWQTNHNLWVNTCQVSPNSHNAWNNIGDDYDKLKDYENAIKGFTQSTIVKPNYADAFHNRANIFFKVGRFDLARESYQTAVRFNPGLFQTYLSLTQVDLMDKKPDLAIQDALTATKVSPGNPQSWYVLGVVLAQTGHIDESKVSFNKALQLAPNYRPAADALAQLEVGVSRK